MRVYLYYLIKEEISFKNFSAIDTRKIIDVAGKKMVLYAYTPDTGVSLFFRQTRDMDLFYEKIIHLTSSEYEEFCDDNPDELIEYHLFNTKKIKFGKYCMDTIYLLCTRTESDSILYYKEEIAANILDDVFTDYIMKVFDIGILKGKYRKSLKQYLLYNDIKFLVMNPADDINCDVCIIDDIALYVRMYKNTLKKGAFSL